MANPFLVLGGIAISVVTAAFGVLAVPGWIASAQDAAATNDLANIRSAQAASVSTKGTYFGDFDELTSGAAGVRAELSGTDLLGLAADGDKWCAAVQSLSGGYFAASEDGIRTKADTDPGAAMTAAGCTAAAANSILDAAYGPLTEVRRNLAVNPAGGAWKPAATPEFGFSGGRWPSFSTYQLVGDWVRLTGSGKASPSGYGFHLAHNPEDENAFSARMVAVQPSATYTMSMKMRLSAGVKANASICWRFGDEADKWKTSSICSENAPVSDVAALVSGSFTVPAGSTRAAAYVVTSNLPDGKYMEATQLLVEKSAAIGSYFDGGMPSGSSLWKTVWAGAANASHSVLLERPRLGN